MINLGRLLVASPEQCLVQYLSTIRRRAKFLSEREELMLEELGHRCRTVLSGIITLVQ